MLVPPQALAQMEELPTPKEALFGTPQAVAAGLHNYAAQGVTHVICNVAGLNAATLPWTIEVLEAYRAQPALPAT